MNVFTDELFTTEMSHISFTKGSHNGSGNVHDYQSQSAGHAHFSYPSEEQAYADHLYTSYPSEEQSYIPESQTCNPEEQLPQIYAPVPMYSQGNLVSSEFCAVQDGVTHANTSYHQTVSSLDPGIHNNTG